MKLSWLDRFIPTTQKYYDVHFQGSHYDFFIVSWNAGNTKKTITYFHYIHKEIPYTLVI